MTISYIKPLKSNLLYSLFFLLLFTACSKEEENIRPIPITDLPCEEQGTYFLSATIGDSVLCYASDSAFSNTYSFFGGITNVEGLGKDSSLLYVQIHDYSNELLGSFQFTVPLLCRYEFISDRGRLYLLYDRDDLEKSLNDKIYVSKSYRTNSFIEDFNFSIRRPYSQNSDIESSYYGNQDSSYIHLIKAEYLYDEVTEGVVLAAYKITYKLQSNLYDGAGNYLYPVKAKGTFKSYFSLLN